MTRRERWQRWAAPLAVLAVFLALMPFASQIYELFSSIYPMASPTVRILS